MYSALIVVLTAINLQPYTKSHLVPQNGPTKWCTKSRWQKMQTTRSI